LVQATGPGGWSDHLAAVGVGAGPGLVRRSAPAVLAAPHGTRGSGGLHQPWANRPILAPGGRAPRFVRGFLLGIGVGAAIWLLSPLLSGRREPWDSEGWYYTGALLASGIVGGGLLPDNARRFVAGIFVGQVLVLLAGVVGDPAGGGLWPLGLVFLAGYSLIALVGALLGNGLRRLLSRRMP
jgi:hypothetical protein